MTPRSAAVRRARVSADLPIVPPLSQPLKVHRGLALAVSRLAAQPGG